MLDNSEHVLTTISAAVGPFAIDEGIIEKPFRKGQSADKSLKTREVRIWQTGTKKILIAHIPIDEESGLSISTGNFEIAGVPGGGAPILMDFRKVRDYPPFSGRLARTDIFTRQLAPPAAAVSFPRETQPTHSPSPVPMSKPQSAM